MPTSETATISPHGDDRAGSARAATSPTARGDARPGLPVARRATRLGVHPYEELAWERRDAVIVDQRDGSTVFEQRDVEFPSSWSALASRIVCQKYFRGRPGTPQRESSLREMIDRVVDTITDWGAEDGYFTDDASATIFNEELKHLLVHQKAAFNSPVWFNVGVEARPQCSACFILSVEDRMDSILRWYAEEGAIFKGGSGAGVNLSAIRSSRERVRGGGQAPGPVSFMRGADASAGTIKSGGKTRRAAKMVILDVDHPDIEDFIACKAREERKIRVLREAGFDMDLDGADIASVQYQNANNAVRVTDAFMRAAEAGEAYPIHAVTTGERLETRNARSVLRAIAHAAWECADPGLQFDTTINRWHTSPQTGRINASNPCSEYMHLDDSACNLASLNLQRFYDAASGRFDVDAFLHAVRVVFIAQEILVDRAAYPTEPIARNAQAYRQLGLGYANLGGLLMSCGLPYDSSGGRALAAALTALMTGQAYRTSAELAAARGPHPGYAANAQAMNDVIRRHRAAVDDIDSQAAPDDLLAAARAVWDDAIELGARDGFRNAQATALAPTGTIGLMMDCDTTGIEPDLGLVKTKQLVGGGSVETVSRSLRWGLAHLGYGADAIDAIAAHVAEHRHIHGAPGLHPEHAAVFRCAMGDDAIPHSAHLAMMAAVQPFLSGAISKTVNLAKSASVEEVEALFLEAWRLGLKAVTVYRDGCKIGQPLSVAGSGDPADDPPNGTIDAIQRAPTRRKLPRSRASQTIAFRVADAKGYITAGEYPDEGIGELFVKLGKQGSTLSGLLDAFAISVSIGLQHGVPLEAYVAKFMNMRFEPAGITDDEEIRFASSVVDYLARRLAIEYLPQPTREALGILTRAERSNGLGALNDGAGRADDTVRAGAAGAGVDRDAPLCFLCGVRMVRAGSCHVCAACGATSGCS